MKQVILGIMGLIIIMSATGCLSLAPVTIDDKPTIKIDENLVGIWKMKEDTNTHDYFVIENENQYQYSVCYMNRGGDNRVYEHNPAWFSVVNGTKFLNVYYRDFEISGGYLFLKVLSIDHNGFEMTAAVLADSMMPHLSTSAQVRKRIAAHINDVSFYTDTLHLRKKLPLRVCK